MTCGEAGGLTKAGTACRCSMNLSATSGLCVMHDPERIAERARVTSAGGTATKVSRVKAKAANPANAPKAPKTLADAVFIAAWATRAVLVGDIDVRVCEAAVKAIRQFQLGEEKRALEEKIKALREELAAARGKANP